MNLIHNEQTKLTATALNNVAVAFVIAGFVGPMVAVGYGTEAMARDAITILVSIIGLFVGFILHSIAKLILRDLRWGEAPSGCPGVTAVSAPRAEAGFSPFAGF